MASFNGGGIDQFEVGQDSSWEEYTERLEFHFQAQGIDDNVKKRAVLLSKCGASTYSLIRSLVTPQKPSEFTFEEIVKRVQDHVTPRPSEIVQRFKFLKRDQRNSETVQSYVTELRKLSEYCNFGNTLEIMLRDRLVCGLRDEAMQTRLLAETDLTFQKALDISVAAETAANNASELRSSSASSQVHAVQDAKNKAKVSQFTEKTWENKRDGCFRCGYNHSPTMCKFADVKCRYCSKVGHIERVCFARTGGHRPVTTKDNNGEPKQQWKDRKKNTHAMESFEDPAEVQENQLYSLNQINRVHRVESFRVQVLINGRKLEMEVDSGSACTLVSEEKFQQLWPANPPQLQNSSLQLRTWSHQPLQVRGSIQVQVEFQGKSQQLPLLVVQGEGSSLLGRDWFESLGIGLAGINLIETEKLKAILDAASPVFQEELGIFAGPSVHIEIDPTVQPKFLKSRSVPFALRDRVDEELDKLIQQGVLVPVKHSDWASPIVPVLKKDGSLRICGDYRSTVNTATKTDTYPLPNITDMLSTLTGGTKFSRIDLAQAYQQLVVDEASAKVLTINTQRGLFNVTRLPFGISSAPGIFQRFMDTQLAGIEGAAAYLDDVLISGDNKSHDERLERVLDRLKAVSLRAKQGKCEFGRDSVQFLGFIVDREGIHPTEEKVEAVHSAPAPKNKTELKAFLGLLNFYGSFLQDRATVLEPLHRLLDETAVWEWTKTHENIFEKAKGLLQSSAVLSHYDVNLPLVLVCDASSYGVGAILSHVMQDGREAPVAYASRTMSKTERNYAQIDREALSIIYGVTKFHKYLYGRSFKIFTDHKPLLGLFNPEKKMPDIMSPRMLRWSLLLSSYSYQLAYRPGKQLANADGLSRLPVKVNVSEPPGLADVFMLENSSKSPLSADEISTLTRRDPLLSRVLLFVLNGWPTDNQGDANHEMIQFTRRRLELSVHKGCLLWGSRVVIPTAGRKEVMKILHASHPGMCRMKALARCQVWWPGLDSEIEDCVKSCQQCQATRNNPARATTHFWEYPEHPWSRLHIDFAGPFHGQVFLLVVDAYSKWLEIALMTSLSSLAVIKQLRRLFATHGLPEVIVSDNGTAFSSSEFEEFLKSNGIRGVKVAPYHPSSNGQAERVVQSAKQALQKMEGEWSTRIARFLITQHATPHTTTGTSPSELLMNRRLITALDRLQPSVRDSVRNRQTRHVEQEKRSTRQFELGSPIYFRNYRAGDDWLPGIITEVTGPLSYKIETTDGCVVRRHVDQLRSRIEIQVNREVQAKPTVDPFLLPVPRQAPLEIVQPEAPHEQPDPGLQLPVIRQPARHGEQQPRPVRIRRQPTYLQDFVA